MAGRGHVPIPGRNRIGNVSPDRFDVAGRSDSYSASFVLSSLARRKYQRSAPPTARTTPRSVRSAGRPSRFALRAPAAAARIPAGHPSLGEPRGGDSRLGSARHGGADRCMVGRGHRAAPGLSGVPIPSRNGIGNVSPDRFDGRICNRRMPHSAINAYLEFLRENPQINLLFRQNVVSCGSVGQATASRITRCYPMESVTLSVHRC